MQLSTVAVIPQAHSNGDIKLYDVLSEFHDKTMCLGRAYNCNRVALHLEIYHPKTLYDMILCLICHSSSIQRIINGLI